MADTASDSSSDADLNEFLGLPEDYELPDEDDGDDEVGNGQDLANGNGKKRGLGVADPLFSLRLVERMTLESNVEGLELMLTKAEAEAGERQALADDPEVKDLQLEVLRMAVALARGDFIEALSSPAVSGIFAPEDTKGYSVSRVKNREGRFLHERVVEHIDQGLGPCVGRKSFKDPSVSSPEDHVNQRALRAVATMFAGVACLHLFVQANWTGPPVSESAVEPMYPLPFLRNVYDGANAETATTPGAASDKQEPGVRHLETALSALEADAKASAAIAGKDTSRFEENLDAFPQLHARAALMLGANGEEVYRDAKFLHFLHVARVILRVVANPTVAPGAVDPTDMLEEAKLVDEAGAVMEDADFGGDSDDDEAGINMASTQGTQGGVSSKPQEEIASSVRSALRHLLTSGWWAARSAVVHQETLEAKDAAAPSLEQEAERGFRRTLRAVDLMYPDDKLLLASVWIECGVARHKFKAADRAKQAFAEAKEAAQLNIQMTGALGKRTKFQRQEKTQLILLAASSTTKQPSPSESASATTTSAAVTPPSSSSSSSAPAPVEGEEDPSAEGMGQTSVLGIPKIKLEEVDAETPLHEQVQLGAEVDDEEARMRRGTLSLLDQCIVLGLCMDVKNSYAMEGLTAEEMLAYVERVLQSPENWMVYSTALLIKSQLEFERNKTKERAILQMQVLVDQQTNRLTPLQPKQRDLDEAAPVTERLAFLHALAWPAVWELKRGLAALYREVGAAGSALQIYEEVRLWEEAVDCLVMMEKRARAEKLVRERLAVQPSAHLMCVLGGLLQDEDWYRKAWEFSGKRHARAKREWALLAFNRGDLQESADHLQDALRINPLFPESWFRLGSCAMRLEQWKLARTAFAHVTRQDPDSGDSWANLSSVLVQLGDYPAALKAVAEAVRQSRSNWKIWENYILLAVNTHQWGMAIDGMSNLVDVRGGSGEAVADMVDLQSLLVLVDALTQKSAAAESGNDGGVNEEKEDNKEQDPHAPSASEGGMSAELTASLRAQLEALFEKMRAKCKSEPNMWKVMSIYYEGVGDLVQVRDCLVRRMRSLMQQEVGWEREELKAERIVSVAQDLLARFADHAERDPALVSDAAARESVLSQASQLARSVVDKLKANEDLPATVYTPLEDVLPK
ncbi:Tetratricopeptide repeat protein 27 [Hondaea fermentalgiana]|uniref:Tetratricopeptide repeat protein 27 n=1 Tax=Hondaea fermentalgiana TaxID=2315210 RepID=A0A2R5GN76_9STRA|nr:Tetratricopeptide repeat protein 27 [Hondaea fermentalgiana]|eukprot:GBG32346.1 Tetratricopeptide repeat protein 27 [Hondaea fermentalgiana]